jgi:hypothetical protein
VITAIRVARIAVCLGLGLTVGCSEGSAAESAALAPCSFASGRDVTGNTVTCNFGLTPEQLKQATEAAVSGATTPLAAQIRAIGKTLDVTEDAAKTLLKIVGEDSNVPEDRLADSLSKVAADYKRLQAQAAVLSLENPTARDLVTQAKAEINAGHLDRAHELLRQATQAQVAAAQEARSLREKAQAAWSGELDCG